MPRIRRSSNVIAKAIVRSNNLKAISPTLDLGGGLSVVAFDQLIAQAEAAQDDYNQTIAVLDEKGNNLDALLKQTSDMSARLQAVDSRREPALGGFNLTFLWLEIRRLLRNRRTLSFTLVADTVFCTRVFRVFFIAHPPTDVAAASFMGSRQRLMMARGSSKRLG